MVIDHASLIHLRIIIFSMRFWDQMHDQDTSILKYGCTCVKPLIVIPEDAYSTLLSYDIGLGAWHDYFNSFRLSCKQSTRFATVPSNYIRNPSILIC